MKRYQTTKKAKKIRTRRSSSTYDPYLSYLLDCGFYFAGSLREIRANPDLLKDLNKQGIYAIATTSWYKPQYLDYNTIRSSNNIRGGILSAEKLQSRWVPDTRVLYIGQSAKGLGEKLRKLVMHMQGETTARGPHIDGEALFHLQSYEYFMVYVLSIERPKEVQSFLIREFKEQFGNSPFANSDK